MRPSRVLAGCFTALAVASASFLAPAGAAVTAADAGVASRAVGWLDGQQRPDGGFELAEFAGYETPEAVLALAAQAQSAPVWSAKQALAAVTRVASTKGRTALDYLDDYADATGDDAITGGSAAKLITLVAAPLCLDARAFDPQRDGATDLVARMENAARPNGAYGPDGVLSDTLYAALALSALGRPVPATTIAYIKAAQESDGSWNYAGNPAPAPADDFDDIDTTALALQALIAGGLDHTDSDVAQAIAYLRGLQSDSGAWQFFGSDDPNATSVAYLALRAAGATPTADPKPYLRSQQQADGHIASPYDAYGSVNTYPTTQTTRALLDASLPVRPAAGTCAGEGYYLFGSDGAVYPYGASPAYGSAANLALKSPVVSGAATPTGRGYHLFAADGGVFTFGDAGYFGSTGALVLNSPVVAGASTPTGRGYFLFAADGGVFTFGDAVFRGSMGATRLNSPVVGGASTPTGRGYFLFAADGGVFTFGDAVFGGSMGGTRLNSPVVGGASTPSGGGYFLFAADGGVFTFGDARFAGSLGAMRLNRPIVGGSTSPLGHGYALFAADGGVFTFGDVVYAGSAAASPVPGPVVAGSID